LFKIIYGKTIKYVLDEKEKEEYLNSLPEGSRNKVIITRMKGLGEMNPDELRETTMSKESRILRKITVEDAMEADKVFETLMGEEVEPRREFIEANAPYAQNLDI